ncbi:hypothetical protein LPJ70_002377, partial [Coemansia sp. RSA 2708]
RRRAGQPVADERRGGGRPVRAVAAAGGARVGAAGRGKVPGRRARPSDLADGVGAPLRAHFGARARQLPGAHQPGADARIEHDQSAGHADDRAGGHLSAAQPGGRHLWHERQGAGPRPRRPARLWPDRRRHGAVCGADAGVLPVAAHHL